METPRNAASRCGAWVGLVLAFLYIPIAVICLYAFNNRTCRAGRSPA